jgi:hypothetical protein
LAIILAGVTASVASNAGVCFEQGKLLSDDDYFKAAVDVVIHDSIDGVVEELPDASIAKLVRSQKYSNPNEFLREFPHCCRFVSPNSGDGDQLEIGITDRIVGIHVVEVSYIKRYLDDGRQKTSETSAKVAVTSCGKGRPFR